MGGIVGGLIFIALLILAIILLRRGAARRSGRQGPHKKGILDAELEKWPANTNVSYLATRPSIQTAEPSKLNDPQGASNLPVADIVELVYKRLQEERPPYEEASTTTSGPPAFASIPRSSSLDPRPLPVPATPGLPPYAPREHLPTARTNTAVVRKS